MSATVADVPVNPVRRFVARLRTVSPWGRVLALLVVGHAVWMSWLQVDLHNGLGTFGYDVGLYDQGIWLLSRGRAPFVTLMGRNLLGDHASLILFLLVPLYWIVPGTPTLLVVQAVVIALGAVPVYLFARRVLGGGGWGVCAAVLWLANPAVNGTGMENFHPDSFLGLTVPLALWAAHERRWRWFAVAVGLSLLVKEDVLILMVPLGAWVAWRLDRRRGVLTMAASVAATVLGMFVLMRSLIGVPTRNGWRIPFGGFGGLLRRSLTDPTEVGRYLLSEDRPLYVFQMLAPFAGVFAMAPWMSLVSLPVIASNVLSTFFYQHSIQYHYSLVAVPALVFATVIGVGATAPRRRALVMGVVVAATCATFVLWGQHPLAVHPRHVLSADAPVAVAGRQIIRQIPADAVISVYDPLSTHLAHRREVYFFPNPFRSLYYGDSQDNEKGARLPAADRVEWVVLPRALPAADAWDWAPEEPYFELVDYDEYWNVFRRKPADRSP